MRIAQLANFHSPHSGGLRVAVERLGAGYSDQGHTCLLIVPGRRRAVTQHGRRRRVELPGVPIPRTPYRLLVDRRALRRELEMFGPDRVEVSDKASLRWVGAWASAHRVPSVLFSHERLDAVLGTSRAATGALRRAAARWTRSWGEAFDAVVCPSAFAAGEFAGTGVAVTVVPLGVDHRTFRPRATPSSDALRLVWVGRMSPEKNAELAIDTLERLVTGGRPTELTMVGDGPSAGRVRRRAGALASVRMTGHIADRRALAREIARHDVFVATGRAETFNLAAAEGLACGLPVVCPDVGATRELLVDGCGLAVPPDAAAYAAAVSHLAGPGVDERRAAARRRALQLDWATSTRRMLAVHSANHARA